MIEAVQAELDAFAPHARQQLALGRVVRMSSGGPRVKRVVGYEREDGGAVGDAGLAEDVVKAFEHGGAALGGPVARLVDRELVVAQQDLRHPAPVGPEDRLAGANLRRDDVLCQLEVAALHRQALQDPRRQRRDALDGDRLDDLGAFHHLDDPRHAIADGVVEQQARRAAVVSRAHVASRSASASTE